MSLPHEAKKDPEQDNRRVCEIESGYRAREAVRWIHRTDQDSVLEMVYRKVGFEHGYFYISLIPPGHPPSFGTTP